MAAERMPIPPPPLLFPLRARFAVSRHGRMLGAVWGFRRPELRTQILRRPGLISPVRVVVPQRDKAIATLSTLKLSIPGGVCGPWEGVLSADRRYSRSRMGVPYPVKFENKNKNSHLWVPSQWPRRPPLARLRRIFKKSEHGAPPMGRLRPRKAPLAPPPPVPQAPSLPQYPFRRHYPPYQPPQPPLQHPPTPPPPARPTP